MSKNIIIKEFNNSVYEELFPKTISSQVQGLENTISAAIGSQGFCKIETGSYIGTGTYGYNNLNRITINKNTKLLIVSNKSQLGDYGGDSLGVWVRPDLAGSDLITNMTYYGFYMFAGMSSTWVVGSNHLLCAWEGNDFVWYSERPSSSSYQLNEPNYTYYWMAFEF